MSNGNLHTVYMSGQPLGVECVCGRRVLLSHEKIDAFSGNMKELWRVKESLKCQACGKRPAALRIFYTEKEARDFEVEADKPGPRF